MEAIEYVSFCRRFFAATGIPVNLLRAGVPVYSSFGERMELQNIASWAVYPPTKNPGFSAINPDLEYGRVHVEGTDFDLFIGPIFTTEVTDVLVHEFIQETRVPQEYREQTEELLRAVPVSSHPQFIRYLLFLHLCLNHKEGNVEDFFGEETSAAKRRNARETAEAVDAKEHEEAHDSYAFEMELYRYIARGDVGRLKKFLDQTQKFPAEGRTAKTPLRHAKNTFIGFAAKAGILGAIPGGVDTEKVYQLTDLYMQECEKLQTVEEVNRLRYIFLMDLCERAGAAKMPAGISPEIRQAAEFIRNHTNTNLVVDEIAEVIHRSASWLMRTFKAEMGMSVGEYMTSCKIEEACDLLRFSDQSLAEISAYLGYSSQAYFQNIFKKNMGVTPGQYRRKPE